MELVVGVQESARRAGHSFNVDGIAKSGVVGLTFKSLHARPLLMPSRRADAPDTVDDYFARVPPSFRGMLQRLRETIQGAAPDAEEIISYGMPAYRQDGILVYFAAFRDHCSLFVPGPEVRRRFSAELRPFLHGKGTIRFTLDRPLPAGLVTRIVRTRVAENAARRSSKARPTPGRNASSRRRNATPQRAVRKRRRSGSRQKRKR